MFDVLETLLSSTYGVSADFLNGLVDILVALADGVVGLSSTPAESVPLTPLVPATPVEG